MNKQRNMEKDTPEHTELKKQIKKKISQDEHNYNTEIIKTTTENNKSSESK